MTKVKTQAETENPILSMAAPAFRWTGCKRKLAPWIAEALSEPISRAPAFYEACAGSASVTLYCIVSRLIPPSTSIQVSDRSPDVVAALRAIRDRPDELWMGLARLIADSSEESYYRVRASEPDHDLARAQRFLYLLGAGYKGLWRTNRAGKMNVPYGHRTSCHSSLPDILRVSRLLLSSRVMVEIASRSVFEVVHAAPRDSVVYVDPPYLPRNETASFSSYSSVFDWAEHERLDGLARDASRTRNVTTVVSGYAGGITAETYRSASRFIQTHYSHRCGPMSAPVTEALYIYEP